MAAESSFGKLLKSLRTAKGTRQGSQWTQIEVARRLGVSRVTYNSWENDVHPPRPEHLRQIVEILDLNDVDTDRLYQAAHMRLGTKNLPIPRNPFFTGRKGHLEQLSKLLQSSGTVEIAQPVSISGLGGIGKTQLALEYAYQNYPMVYRTVLWVNADVVTIQSSYGDLVNILDLPQRHESDTKKRVEAVKYWLEKHSSWLLIMDNADDIYVARSFFPSTYDGHILLTTRSQIIGTVGKRLEIEAMELTEGVCLLLRRAQLLERDATLETVLSDERAAARELVELMGGHPLALDQAGACIEETGTSVVRYRELYRESRRSLLERRGASGRDYGDHPESVAVTFKLSFERAEQQYPLAAHILCFCAFLQPDAIPEELLQAYSGFADDPVAFGEGIAALLRYSLLRWNASDKTYSLHRLVQTILVDRMPPEVIVAWKYSIVRVLSRICPINDYKPSPAENLAEWTSLRRLLPHMVAYTEWAEPNPEVSIYDWHVLYQTGSSLENVLKVSGANHFFLRAFDVAQKLQWHDQPELGVTLVTLGDIYLTQGKHQEAEAAALRAFSLFEKHFNVQQNYGPIGGKIHQLAQFYEKKGDLVQAEHLHWRALAYHEKHYGAIHPITASSTFILGTTYCRQQDFLQAEALFRRSLAVWDELSMADHPEAAITAYCLAMVMHMKGENAETEPLFIRAISDLEKQLGQSHPQTIDAKKSYVTFLRVNARHSDADAIEKEIQQS